MKLDALTMREKTLITIWEKLCEIVGLLEDFFPDMAEELRWICENLKEELRTGRQATLHPRLCEEDL